MRQRWLIPMSLLSLGACSSGSDVILRRVATDQDLRDKLRRQTPFVLEFDPSVPIRMEPGESMLISVRPTLASGESCRFCEVRWTSSDPEVATLTPPEPRCGGDRCAILEAVTAGRTILTVSVCLVEYQDCKAFPFPLTVQ